MSEEADGDDFLLLPLLLLDLSPLSVLFSVFDLSPEEEAHPLLFLCKFSFSYEKVSSVFYICYHYVVTRSNVDSDRVFLFSYYYSLIYPPLYTHDSSGVSHSDCFDVCRMAMTAYEFS